ncbi:MAG: TetR/AcrR family transcriptional regulator [Gammaproteobacteria bacterium]|nr:TetR/AcrR family transcriptional regulator [Gammaproteobacteria bacterium]
MNQHSSSEKIPKTRRGRETREKLLQAAEIEFGERGFHEAAISGITQRAGVALGTFYVYFNSKEEIFRALVTYMSHLTRTWIYERVAESPDRLAAEREGVKAFVEFVRQHKNLYRIVSEAQFVAEDAYRDYYTTFANSYRENLQLAADNSEIRGGDFDVWAWALIGMNVFVGMRFAAWEDAQSADDIAESITDLIGNGMLGSKGS